MRIMICGSMTFAKEMLQIKKILEDLGHLVDIPTDALEIVNGEHNHDNLDADYDHCIKRGIMKEHFKLIENSDAMLVLNFNKNNINGYIGTATLMEIGIAYHFNKKIFLLHKLPSHSEHRWVHEVRITQPIIIDGDLSKIN